MKSRSFFTNTFLTLAYVALVALTPGCSHSPFKTLANYSIELPQILEQVNNSIQAAKKLNGGSGPEITSIELDLQVESETQSAVSVPLVVVTPEVEVDDDSVHRISVTFKPKPVKFDSPIDKTKASELTTLIAAIDNAVANANPIYNFEKGSVKIQCTFKQTGGLETDSRDSSDRDVGKIGTVKLTPIQIGAKHSRQSIQTITLNFSPVQLNPNARSESELSKEAGSGLIVVPGVNEVATPQINVPMPSAKTPLPDASEGASSTPAP